MKSFESWSYEDVEIEFEIERNYNSEILNNWLKSDIKPSQSHLEFINILKDILFKNVNALNEDELKMQFISPFISLINFNTDNYKPFSQRSITLKTDKVETSGIVDFMVAKGKTRPKEPLFFLHEYKQQHPSKKNDPLGQLLIAMVAAYFKNNNSQPVYGILVEGRFWYFVVFQQKEYAVSYAYDASDDDIFQIYSILNKTKNYIDDSIIQKK